MKHSFVMRQRPTLVLLGILAIASGITYGHAFWLDNSIIIAIFALMAISVGLCYGQAGILSMATAGFASVGAFGTAILTTRYGLSPYIGLVFAVLAPMLLAYPIARALTRLSPMPLSMATFLLSGILEIAVREGGDFTGGYIGLSGIPRLSIAETAQGMHFVAWGSCCWRCSCASTLCIRRGAARSTPRATIHCVQPPTAWPCRTCSPAPLPYPRRSPASPAGCMPITSPTWGPIR